MNVMEFRTRLAAVSRVTQEIGDPWFLLILWLSSHGVSRFEDYRLRTGISRGSLSARLRRLIDLGYMQKVPVAPGARRMEYRLTSTGEEAAEIAEALSNWKRKSA